SSAIDVCDDPAPGIDQGATYIVGECEWLIRIANRLGIDYDALIGVNPDIENPNIIYPGQVINLPPR
ncbi:MAG: LysM peptidoglycan-binding domain-containing protein, partial [Chloroflexi bacterium]|nr:LysM peptidoglycan-binding domain-containing protein [Chloroflexota bacterium]